MRCKIKTAPSPPLTPSLLQVCEQLMTMHLAGRRSAAGKPSPGKSHLLRHSQLAAGVPDAIVSHTKGHADVVDKIQRYKIYTTKMQSHLNGNLPSPAVQPYYRERWNPLRRKCDVLTSQFRGRCCKRRRSGSTCVMWLGRWWWTQSTRRAPPPCWVLMPVTFHIRFASSLRNSSSLLTTPPTRTAGVVAHPPSVARDLNLNFQ